MIVVFDTCTQPEYRRDVHRVLALPRGAVIRYEYKRKLISTDAANKLENFSPIAPRLPTILIYGQLRSYQLGDPDEGLPMLTWESAVFVPTRSAVIVSVKVVRANDPKDDVFHFHLQLKGFIDPAVRELEHLIKALQQRNSLPFGDVNTQYVWVSLLPEDQQNPITSSLLISDNDSAWTEVIRVLCSAGTQFSTDIFWRITGLTEVRSTQNIDIPLENRRGNRWGQIDWHRDYTVYQRRRYRVEYQTYDPTHHGRPVKGNATLALIPTDSEALVLVPTTPVGLRPNQNSSAPFSIGHSARIGGSFASLEVETQIPDWNEARFDPGSRCSLTLHITRSKATVASALILALFGCAAAAIAAMKPELHVSRSIICAILVLLCGGGAYLAWTGKIKE
jgi:hypothetical protein